MKAAASGTLKLHIKTDTISEQRTAHNVIADTKRGRADNVVVMGAHLDSVTKGPGINDNGSGTATVLTVAEQIGKLGTGIKNKVRFAFWGAEEEGLLGSDYYVTHLTAAQKARIALNLNFDMLGSPNGRRGVYDGDDSRTPAPTRPRARRDREGLPRLLRRAARWRPRRASSTAAPTTGRSSTTASRPAASTPAPRS